MAVVASELVSLEHALVLHPTVVLLLSKMFGFVCSVSLSTTFLNICGLKLCFSQVKDGFRIGILLGLCIGEFLGDFFGEISAGMLVGLLYTPTAIPYGFLVDFWLKSPF